MLFFGAATPTTVPGVQLLGPGLGYADGVKKLQSALIALAAQTGDPKYDPGTKGADGIIGRDTRMATGYAINLVATSLSSSLRYLALPAAVIAMSGSDRSDSFISSQSVTLAAAILAYVATRKPAAAAALPVTLPLAPEAGYYGPPWYTTTQGKVALVCGAGVVLILLLKK